MSERTWNDDQKEAIKSVDENTLVSASAGSGKTAVTIERIIRIIKSGTPVREIVMLAFSNAVAAELKDRISAELVKAMREDGADKEYLREQIDDVTLADISTVHSFCGNIVKEFFEEAGIDPSYSILEPEEKEGMLDKSVDAVLKEYGEKADPLVSSLKFTFGGDGDLRAQIKRVYDFLESQPDRKKWLDEAFSGYGNGDAAAKYFIDDCKKTLEDIRRAADALAEGLGEYKGFDPDNKVGIYLISEACKEALGKDGEEFIAAAAKIDLSFSVGRAMGKKAVEKVAAETGIDPAFAAMRYKELRSAQKSFVDKLEREGGRIKKLAAYTADKWAEYGEKVGAYVKKLAEIVGKVAEAYAEEKRSENKMDFADLEYYAIKILENPEIAKEISSRYKYVCIDEYQDTNYVQEYVLSRISNGHNLFMVGDVKQSIYQFRLTETEIFLSKYDRYGADGKAGKLVTLNQNYRSDRRILDFVNEIFSKIMTRENGGVDYAGTAMLNTDKEPVICGDEPVVRICPLSPKKKKAAKESGDGVYSVRENQPEEDDGASEEARYIAEKIASLVGKKEIGYYADGKPVRRKIEYRDITLLCAKRSQRVKAIIEYLHEAGVPVAGANITGDGQNASVNVLMNLLKVIDNPLQDVALVAVMKSVFGGFDCSELANIRKEYPKEEYFHECVKLYAAEKEDVLSEKIRVFFDGIRSLREFSAQAPVGRLLEEAIARYSFDKYALSRFGREDCDRMRAFVAGLEGKSYAVTLQAMLAYGEDVSLSGKSAERPEDDNCVQTSTIHSSKGLEYPVVFVMDAAARFSSENGDLLLDKDLGMAMRYPEEDTRLKRNTLKYLACARKLEKKNTEERMRLFYVALTRAKNMLFVTGTASDFASGIKAETSFMNWLNNVAVLSPGFCEKYVENYASAEEGEETEEYSDVVTFAKPSPQKLSEIREYLEYEYPYAKSARTGIKHTVTGINKENPADYGTIYVKNWFEEDSAGVGTAYHKVMENVDYDSADEQAVAEQIKELYEKGVLDELSAKAVDPGVVFRCLCSDVITKARACEHMREKQFMLRVSAKDVIEDGSDDKILVQGTVDLLIPDRVNGTATVVDFKMSKLPPERIAARYRKQLELYALAAENGLGLKVDKKLIYVLGQDVILEV